MKSRERKALLKANGPFVARAADAPYQVWGADHDVKALEQMKNACALPVAVGRRADARRARRLRAADRRCARHRGRRHPVRRRRRHRLPHEDDRARPAAARRSSDEQARLTTRIERETRFGVGASFQTAAPARGDGRRLASVTPITARSEGQGVVAARHERQRQPLRRVRRADACRSRRSASQPGEYLALLSHSGSRGTGAQIARALQQGGAAGASRAAAGALAPGVARSRRPRLARNTGRRWS